MSIVVSATQELYCAKDDDGCVYCNAGRFCNRALYLSSIGFSAFCIGSIPDPIPFCGWP